MKKGDTNKQSFIDILFEGRNKEYGAYYLRIHERKYLLRSLFITCICLIFLLLLPDIITFLESKRHSTAEFVYIPVQQDELPKGDITLDYVPPPPPREKLNTPPKIVPDAIPEPINKDDKKPDPKDDINTDKKSKDSLSAKRPTGDPNSNIEGITMVVDQLPSLSSPLYKDFQDYIGKNLKLPETESILRHNGKVWITVLFGADGLIISAKVVQGLTPELNAEALRVIKAMPRVNPARRHGKAVATYAKFPVEFRAPDGLAKGK